MFRLICLFIGYCFGCIQTAYLLGRFFAKIDIREHGSGNSGATNVLRVMGTKMGILVFAVDIIKAVLGYLVCSLIFGGIGTFYNGGSELSYLPGIYGGIGVILGHNFPFFLGFKGGKGSASGIGVILATDIRVALISYIVGIITLATSKYMSLASLILWVGFVSGLVFFRFNIEIIGLGVFMLLLSAYQHRGNIKRLLKGEERKFTFKPNIEKK